MMEASVIKDYSQANLRSISEMDLVFVLLNVVFQYIICKRTGLICASCIP